MVYQIGAWEIEKEPYCDECAELEICADMELYYAAGCPYSGGATIRCKHLDRCRGIADRLKKMEDAEDDQGDR